MAILIGDNGQMERCLVCDTHVPGDAAVQLSDYVAERRRVDDIRRRKPVDVSRVRGSLG
jgi:hypothetical protein